MMKNNQRKERSILGKNFEVLKLVFKFCPFLAVVAVIYIISCVVTSLLKVFIISYAIELVLTNKSFDTLLISIIMFTSLELLCLLFKILYEDFFEPRYRNVYIKKIQLYLFKKVKEIDMEEYDNPVFYSKFSRALRDSQWRGFRVYRTFVDFIKSVAVSIALGTYLIITDLILILIIFIAAIISLFMINKINALWYKMFRETEAEHRFYWYINRTFYNQRYAAELKTTSVSDLLVEKYKESVNSLENKTIKIQKKMVPYQTINAFIINIVSQGGTYIYLAYKLFNNLMSVSVFSSSINATLQFANNFLTAASVYTSLKEHARYIDDFLWAINYKPHLEINAGVAVNSFENLEINNLCFKYNNTDQLVINDLSMKLSKGDKIAIVGHNGSGKTTLIKLLLKFYNYSSGDIIMNNTSYQDINPFVLRKNIAAVFQDYQVYAVTIAENILMRRVVDQNDEQKVLEALDKVGLKEKVESLPLGIHTQMTKEFDATGQAFSGGERQRLVVARVFANDADIYILDEPTASLDPLAEEQINKLIINTALDKTIIIIAHRLSTVVDTDRIYLMKDGNFKEIGTHQELLDLNKDYALMFNTQKHLYEKHN